MRAIPFTLLLLSFTLLASSLSAQDTTTYTRADTLRGSFDTPGRNWWDVTFYDLHVAISPSDSSISGWNGITYRVTAPGKELQLDLMEPLQIDSVLQDGRKLAVRREGDAWFASPRGAAPAASASSHAATASILVYYHGRPQVAKNPP